MLHSNVQKAGQNVYNIFLTWRPYAAGNSVRRKSAKTAVRSGENSARMSGTGCRHPARSLLQPALTSEKTEKFINSIYSNNLFYVQATDQPAQLS